MSINNKKNNEREPFMVPQSKIFNFGFKLGDSIRVLYSNSPVALEHSNTDKRWLYNSLLKTCVCVCVSASIHRCTYLHMYIHHTQPHTHHINGGPSREVPHQKGEKSLQNHYHSPSLKTKKENGKKMESSALQFMTRSKDDNTGIFPGIHY